jgi:RNA polymerase sigma-70 factor (ECF subfamily)
MGRTAGDEHLSQISTLWTMLLRAHTPADDAAAAQHELLERYGGAVGRYLLGAVHDPDAAAELTQEFAVRFLRGDFRRADPGRGRFRDYLKTALIHLVTDHHRARQGAPRPLPAEVAAASGATDDEDKFLASWRAELLDRTWDDLAASHPTEHAVLMVRVAEPDLPSSEIGERAAERLGRPISAAAARKALQRAHGHFAELLVAEVGRSLDEPTARDLEAELRELDLLRYCRSAMSGP